MATKTTLAGLKSKTLLRDAARLLLEARLLDVRQYEATLAAPPFGVQPVHDMRVASRRLREALHILGSRKLRPLEAEVKRLQDALGAVRDAQLLGQWLRQRKVTELKDARLNLRRASKGLEKALTRWEQRTVPSLQRAIAGEKRKGSFGGGKVRRRVRARLDTMFRRLEPVLLAPRPVPVHELRKAVKKLRYAAELVSPAFSAAKALAEAVEPLQTGLGELHDVDVFLELVDQVAPKKLLAVEREKRAESATALLELLAAFREQKISKKARSAF